MRSPNSLIKTSNMPVLFRIIFFILEKFALMLIVFKYPYISSRQKIKQSTNSLEDCNCRLQRCCNTIPLYLWQIFYYYKGEYFINLINFRSVTISFSVDFWKMTRTLSRIILILYLLINLMLDCWYVITSFCIPSLD